MRKIVIGGVVLGALVLAGCDEKSSGSGEAPAQSASATAATVPASSASAAPEKKEEKKEEKKAEGPKDHKERLKAYEDAWASHDAKKISALYAEDGVVKRPGKPDVKGRADIEKDATSNFAAFKDIKLTFGRSWEKDKHTIVVEWVASGTDTGEWPAMGIEKATNKPFGIVGASWLEVGDDGFIKEERNYHDTPTLVKQIKDEKKEGFRAIVSAAPDGHDHFGSKDAAPSDGKDGKESKEAKKEDKKEEKKEDKAKKEDKKDDSSKSGEAEKKNLDLEAKVIDLQNAGKWDDFYKVIAESYTFVDYTQDKDAKGKPAFKELVHTYFTAFPDVKVKSNNSFAAGDFVVEEFEYTGTNKGPVGGAKATNKPVDFHQLEVDEFKDGKFVRSWSWGDNDEIYKELGLDKKEDKKEEKKEKHEKK